jgi:hypothetical protein
MMRETLNSNAAAITMVQGTTGGRIAQMGTRSGTGGTMGWVTGDQYTTMPVWFKLQRAGNVFTAYQSSDGVTWFAVGSSTVAMANTYSVGLAACSGDVTNNTTETSNFDNVGPIANNQNNLIANGTYVIKSVYSGLAIDDPASSRTLGQVMQQYTVNSAANQHWTVNNLGNNVITLTNVASGLALDITGGSKANSALVDQYTYQGNAWQKWSVVSLGGGSYELTSLNSGLALDVVAGVKTVGAQIDQYPYRGNAWQQWSFVAP